MFTINNWCSLQHCFTKQLNKKRPRMAMCDSDKRSSFLHNIMNKTIKLNVTLQPKIFSHIWFKKIDIGNICSQILTNGTGRLYCRNFSLFFQKLIQEKTFFFVEKNSNYFSSFFFSICLITQLVHFDTKILQQLWQKEIRATFFFGQKHSAQNYFVTPGNNVTDVRHTRLRHETSIETFYL
jgi:hypothetical protein